MNIEGTPAQNTVESITALEGEGAPTLELPNEGMPDNSDTPPEGVAANPEAETPPPQEDVKEKAFRTLAKKERDLRIAQKTIKDKEKQFNEQKKLLEQVQNRLNEMEAKLSDPFKALEHSGKSLAELNEIALNDGNETPEMKIKRLEKMISDFQKTQSEKEQEAIRAREEAKAREIEDGLSAFQNQTRNYVNTNAKAFPLTVKLGQQDTVYEVIRSHFDATSAAGKPEVLSVEEAAKKTEAFLRKEFEDIIKVEDVQAIINQTLGSSKEQKVPQQTRDTPNTLTNSSTSTPRAGGMLSRDESIAEAAKLLRWK